MVNIYKPQFSLLQQEILSYLMAHTGKSFNARGLARPLGRTQAGIIKAIPELEKAGFVKTVKDKDSGRWAIEFNRDNPKSIEMKRIENLRMIYECGIVSFLEESLPGAVIILFGSYSYGEDTIRSDIDFAVIGCKGKKIDLSKFEKIFEKEIRINFYDNFEDIDKNLRSNIFNGIVLAGRIGL